MKFRGLRCYSEKTGDSVFWFSELYYNLWHVIFWTKFCGGVFLWLLWCSGYSLLRDPQYNKGLAFTEKERDAHYLRGLLPPTVSSQQLQVALVIIGLEFIYKLFFFSFSDLKTLFWLLCALNALIGVLIPITYAAG